MKSIFNSLGSNYSMQFVAASLSGIFFSKKSDILKLENLLSRKYGGEVLNVYKGRDAIEACFRVLLSPGSQVISQAFSCFAIEEGLVRAGMIPVYADISEKSTNVDVASLDATLKQYPEAKAVLLQHSLGIPAASVSVRKWCNSNGLLLIDDIAQGIGGVDTNGEILGLQSDAVIVSYGKDKIVDAVAGGSVVFRNLDDEKRERLLDVKKMIGKVPFSFVYEDLVYPDVTSLIRKTHHFGLGKVVFKFAKTVGLLSSPIASKTKKMTWMHPAYAKLALLQFQNLEKQLEHRRAMAEIYFETLSKSNLQLITTEAEIQRSSNLRFSIRCKDTTQVNKLIAALKSHRIYVSDRWYRSAVDCGSFSRTTVYKVGSCPKAEKLASQILNLPTHREVNPKIVKKICSILLEISE